MVNHMQVLNVPILLVDDFRIISFTENYANNDSRDFRIQYELFLNYR